MNISYRYVIWQRYDLISNSYTQIVLYNHNKQLLSSLPMQVALIQLIFRIDRCWISSRSREHLILKSNQKLFPHTYNF